MRLVTVDVVVVGAGPAGCAVAVRLSELGYSVCMVERSKQSRPGIGETFTPGVEQLLATIDLAHVLQRVGSAPMHEMVSNWEHGEFELQPASGQLVDRGEFDDALRQAAVARGVALLRPATIVDYELVDDAWRLSVRVEAAPVAIAARFLVDASGRRSFWSRDCERPQYRTLALAGCWQVARTRRPTIETAEAGWLWGMPLARDRYCAFLFADMRALRRSRGTSLMDAYVSRVRDSAVLRGCGATQLLGGVHAFDATPRLGDDLVSARHIRIGDAAVALDPLSSSGVQKSIRGALAGAIVANTILRRPSSTDIACKYYMQSITSTYAQHERWSTAHYGTVAARYDNGFWRDRSAGQGEQRSEPAASLPMPNTSVALAADTTLVDVPVLDAEWVALRPALCHPALEQPVAYIAGVEVAPLLAQVVPGVKIEALIRAWARHVPQQSAIAIAGWLCSREILLNYQRRDQAGTFRL